VEKRSVSGVERERAKGGRDKERKEEREMGLKMQTLTIENKTPCVVQAEKRNPATGKGEGRKKKGG
jgi:hypothetical protein